jgi:pimeloyl-ACP methyl ester carboxylesterase
MTLVLVHGAWHGGWCWEAVVPLLERDGLSCRTVELPLTSLEDDIAHTKALLDEISSDVVLVGHSYGGSVISGAGVHPRVKALVFVTAAALQPWETTVTHQFSDLSAEVTERQMRVAIIEGEFVSIDPDHAVEFFYHDCDPHDAERAKSQLRPMASVCLNGVVGGAAWKDRPNLYVVTTEDRAIPRETQQHMAERIGARVVKLPTGHSPFYAKPEALANVIAEFVAQVGE